MTKITYSPDFPEGKIEEHTAEEIAQKNLDKADTSFIDEQTAKASNQASGNQKLLDLGLTQAEATALTGYTPPVEE